MACMCANDVNELLKQSFGDDVPDCILEWQEAVKGWDDPPVGDAGCTGSLHDKCSCRSEDCKGDIYFSVHEAGISLNDLFVVRVATKTTPTTATAAALMDVEPGMDRGAAVDAMKVEAVNATLDEDGNGAPMDEDVDAHSRRRQIRTPSRFLFD